MVAHRRNIVGILSLLVSLIILYQQIQIRNVIVTFNPRSRADSDMLNANSISLSEQSSLGQSLKDCLVAESSGDLWQNFTSIINRCVVEHAKVTATDFFQLHMGRFDEIKYFLPMTDAFESDDLMPCFWLTIGVGGDTQVEQEMKASHPKCKIFGVEPSPDQYKDFDKYGTIIPLAIGVYAGNLTMRLLRKGGYVDVLVPITPMHELLDKHIGSRLIHFATLDIEGFEYPILEALKFGKPIESTGVRFCQIDAELHSLEHQAKQHVGKNFDFIRYWKEFIKNSPYVPIKASDFLAHRKITLINAQDMTCRRLFNFDRFF